MLKSPLISPTPALLLAAALAAAPLPTASPSRAASLSESESSQLIGLSLLPASTDLVVWLDYAALRKSDLVAEMESRIDSVPEAADSYREFVRDTGLDPRRDADQVMMSLRRALGPGGEGFLLVARGRFAGSRLVDAAAAKGGTVTTTPKGIKIWSSRSAQGGGGDAGTEAVMALAQPDPGTVLFGGEAEVERAANVAIRAKSPAAQETRFRLLLASVDRKAPVWALLSSGTLMRQITSGFTRGDADTQEGDALRSVEAVRLSAWVGKDVDLKVQLDGKDAETAGQLADVVRGMIAAGKLTAKDSDPELLKILQEMSVEEKGKGIEVKARIPGSRLRPPAGEASAKP